MKPAPEPALAARWDALAAVLVEYRDVLEQRMVDEAVPPALVARGFAEPLLALSEEAVIELELGGAQANPPAHLPAGLHQLYAAVGEACALPALSAASEPTRALRRLETPRKRAQVEALAKLTPPLLQGASRVVEVGSGHGHLAREVAEQIEGPVLGLELDRAISARANDLENRGRLSFQAVDVLREGLTLNEGDCALGLHACGELGDTVVTAVAERAKSLLLVGCCLQKQRAERRFALNQERLRAAELSFSSSILALSNLTPREQGNEASRAENVRAREHRIALHALLVQELGSLRFGAELDGIPRRAPLGEFTRMVEAAFRARSLVHPSAKRVEQALSAATVLHSRMRRCALPRLALGRALETFVLVDRALYLEQAGFEVQVGTAFPKELSARNLTLVARRLGSSASQ
jgi:hypothetical protein